MAGTLNLADPAEVLVDGEPKLVTAVSMLFLVAFGIKGAIFPFFFWLPASYHTPPAAISALFAGLLTKVGVYAIIRAFTLVFVQEPSYTGELIMWLAALTMASGVLGAAVQGEVRRILSFHIISQIGYMLMGLGVALVANAEATRLAENGGSEEAIAAMRGAAVVSMTGSVFYILHHIIVKTNLFFVAGVIQSVKGTGDLARCLPASDRGFAFLRPAAGFQLPLRASSRWWSNGARQWWLVACLYRC